MGFRDESGLSYEDRLLKNATIELELGNKDKAEQLLQKYFQGHESFEKLECIIDGWEICATEVKNEPDADDSEKDQPAKNKPEKAYHVDVHKLIKTESFDFPV